MMERLILQREQLDDLAWANDCVANCDRQDCQLVALNMMKSLSKYGTSSLVKKSAINANESAMSFCSACPQFAEMVCSSVRLHESSGY